MRAMAIVMALTLAFAGSVHAHEAKRTPQASVAPVGKQVAPAKPSAQSKSSSVERRANGRQSAPARTQAARPPRSFYPVPYDPQTAALGDGFLSGSHFIRMEVLRAAGEDPFEGTRRPAVAILHGASGIAGTRLYHLYAEELNKRGIHAYIVYYYDGLPGVRNPSSPAHYPQRDRIIEDAIEHLAGRPEVDANRIGFFGVSLGGFHTLQIAATDKRVKAAVSLVGAMPRQLPLEAIAAMPPTLILHGDEDRIVPVDRAYEAASILDQVGAPYELVVYDGEGHGFSAPARDDSVHRTGDFFDIHLNGRDIFTAPSARPQRKSETVLLN